MAEKIKGAALNAFARWYSGHHGTEEFPRWLEGLSPDQRVYFDPSRPDLGIRGHRWYPAPVVHGVLDGIFRDLEPDDAEVLVRNGAEAIVEASLQGFLRVLFRMFVTPTACRLLSQRHWSFHYQSGRVKVEEAGASAHHMEVRDWQSHHPVLCRLNAAAGEPLYRSTGCREVTSRQVGCIEQGDPCCVYSIEWRS